MLQLQPSRGAVQAPGPHHPVPGVGLRAAGGLGPGAPAAAGPRQQGVEAVVSAGVVPLVAAADERRLVDEQGALGVVLPRLTRFRFLRVGGGGNQKLDDAIGCSSRKQDILMESMRRRVGAEEGI